MYKPSSTPRRRSSATLVGVVVAATALLTVAQAHAQPEALQKMQPAAGVTVGLAPVLPGEFAGDVRTLRPAAKSGAEKWHRPLLRPPRFTRERDPFEALAPQQPPTESSAPMPSPIANFAGMSRTDACTGGSCGSGWPPDTTGDVGPNHYIQAVNSGVAIYNKTGTLLASFTEDSLWSGVGTSACNGDSQGDPVVLYDWAADRFVLSWFAFAVSGGLPVSPFYQCIAASKTADPVAGGWWLYAVRMDPGGAGLPAVGMLNDYGKVGLWHDCLYLGANEFQYPAGSYGGVAYASFSRANLYSGAALTHSIGFTPGNNIFTLVPSHSLGKGAAAAQPGTPNYFVSESQTAFQYEVRKFTAGANCGGGGTLGSPTLVSQASYTFVSGAIVPQPSTTNTLDMIDDRIMQKAHYRKVGGTESVWVTHTVGTGGKTAMQWAQINVTGGTVVGTPAQQGIHAPDATLYRFMGSIAVDKMGNMALGYSTSGTSAPNFPSIKYAGRLVSDPINTLPQTETTLVAGLGSQVNNCGGSPCDRWGDYSSMSVDPSDDCTFWYTNEYYSSQTNGTSGNWQTRIGSFRFPSCVGAPTSRKLRDFDGNGKSDLLWRNSVTGNHLLWLQDGGVAVDSSAFLPDVNWQVTHTAFFDSDSYADILWRNSSTGAVVMWLMNGKTAATGAQLLADPNWSVTQVGDFNGDGKADLLWRNSVSGETVMWLMDGFYFIGGGTLLTDLAWQVTQVGDFNGDGKTDLLWRNSATGATVMWLMNGKTMLSGATLLTSTQWSVTHVGDFNGDGKADLLWRNAATGETAAWLMSGTSFLSGAGLLSDPSWSVQKLADLNGDGRADIVWRNSATGEIVAWLMNGASLSSGARLLPPGTWNVVTTGDYNGDGKADLVFKNTATNEVVMWLMNGTLPTAGFTLTTDPQYSVTP
jgi:hypothetical protein